MKAKVILTVFIILMNVNYAMSQQIIYSDQTNVEEIKKDCGDACEVPTVYYKVDEVIPNSFTTANQTLVICRLVPDGKDAKVVCSTEKPSTGWGSMVVNDNEAGYSYSEKHHNQGADIYSMAFTDPNHGWAVGSLDEGKVNCGVIFYTADGGSNWQLQYKSGTDQVLNSIGFTDDQNGWIKGSREVGDLAFDIILTTHDGGSSWIEENLAQRNETNK